ncbi:hypothetical protein, partial [uncultured Bifidobacterium sp.]|uniref:hypothetical protein n=1 Tax=uncultured Bifidobacterium sp. TaxID=165187 RepID=UPI00263571CC
MRFVSVFGGAFLFGFLVAGCSGPSHQVNPNITVYDRDTVADRPITLPGNYSTENYGRLVLALDPGSMVSNAFDESNMAFMSLRLQSELSKLKRFSVVALHGRNTERLEEMADLGELELPEADPTTVDLVANWNLNIHAEERLDGREKEITFICAINLTCTDMRTKLVKFSKDLDCRVRREQRTSRAGTVIGGFQYRNKSDVQGLLQDLATQAAIRIANELGNEFPVGGKITGMLGTDMLTLDKGSEQGIAKGMQMVVYANVGGVDVPLGNAEATPSTNTSQLEMWR